MDVQEAARRVEVSASTIYGLCAQGRMPHSRVGLRRGVIRISEDDLKVYLESCRADLPASSKVLRQRITL